MTGGNESQMTTGLINNDKGAIDLIYNTYNKRIYAFAFSYLKVKDDALDVVHEVFIKLWENRHRIEAGTKIEAFVFTITKNTVLSIFRKKASEKKYLEHLTKVSVTDDYHTQEQLDYNFLKETIDGLVEELSPKRQEVFLRSRRDGLSNKEIAQQLNISEKTVEDHITKALAFLRKRMEEMGIIGTLFFYLFI